MAWANFQQAFYDRIKPYLPSASQQTGIPQSVIFAQAALESNWGRSAPQNNYFGIKGEGGTQATREFINGQWVTKNESFRGYSSLEDSVKGWVSFITNPNSRRWTNAREAGTPQGAIAGLASGGYATDPQYATKLNQIVNNIPQTNLTTQTNTAPGVSTSFTGANATLSGFIAGLPGLTGMTGIAAAAAALAPETTADIIEAGVELNPVTGIIDFFKSLFSQDNAIRFIVVLIGLAAVIAAFASVVMSSPASPMKLIKGMT